MNIEFVGKAVQWTDAMKSFVESKLERFSRLLKEAEEDQVEVVVTLSASRAKHKEYAGESRPTVYRVDLDLYLKTWGGGVIHAWEEDIDVFSALDKVLDEAERQIIKLKQRRLEQRRRGAKIKEEVINAMIAPSEEREKPQIIEEELVIEKPMSEEDAILELQESGVYFLPFIDAKTGELKIAYRKRGGSFGILNTKCKEISQKI
ncbi:ribosome hibernation-promoting factor, HPF/YfiA family [Thermocrinis jamiesonii]|jgi:SSU ribosomal protein S30P/sigma 54 modulation protein|uniref:ribosome hibernation-promoting factor, HPF/YfiA family n=1 Tax=Thermocrinis jamiesonii TaxID=1302351 RepID=UPI0004984EAF|nr:ribosome-associated translation inhibitor RaiA [Thermocrinis jamiesonii]